jgi:hypothetical protein
MEQPLNTARTGNAKSYSIFSQPPLVWVNRLATMRFLAIWKHDSKLIEKGDGRRGFRWTKWDDELDNASREYKSSQHFTRLRWKSFSVVDSPEKVIPWSSSTSSPAGDPNSCTTPASLAQVTVD